MGSRPPLTADYELDYYYFDARYNRSLGDHAGVFVGYKVGYHRQDYDEVQIGGQYFYNQDLSAVAHGPIVGANVSMPVKNTPLSVYGSVATMPIGVAHWDTSINEFGMLPQDVSTSSPAWFLNPEIGAVWHINNQARLGLCWWWHGWGTYDEGPEVLIHGPALTFTYHF